VRHRGIGGDAQTTLRRNDYRAVGPPVRSDAGTSVAKLPLTARIG
jgi:hypothetical protein